MLQIKIMNVSPMTKYTFGIIGLFSKFWGKQRYVGNVCFFFDKNM